jgi:ABC-type multidrug transport system ATPase subunit
VERLKSAGRTIILTTRTWGSGAAGGRVAIMDHGRVIALGTRAISSSIGVEHMVEFQVRAAP